ncbi:hypothetical protein OC25_07360 [Pedobacter kyungheensis]|uniref:Uncharacterized protein n=1 Tax=Pedobacter kyungheensis TaxID=1069985 RepID=A0A0C1DMB0_9SPHI|nr:DUF4179 domain-containing protein [Pedobacter kyungheensis]KIA95145.1 hypothetical protein OC25_07360 [Pedobacter kyungheensis]
MKNSNKLFDKKIELKNCQISGGLANLSYQNINTTYTNNQGCTVTVSKVVTDNKQLVEECFFTNCP